MNSKINRSKSLSYLDILFENRNKSYGSYELRKNYSSRLRNAMIILVTLLGILVLTTKTEKGIAVVETTPLPDKGPQKLTEVRITPPKNIKQKNPTAKVDPPKTPKTLAPKIPTTIIPKVVANPLVTTTTILQPIVTNPAPVQTTTDVPSGPATTGLPGGPTSGEGPTTSTGGGSTSTKNKDGISTTVDQAPAFPGGDAALTAFLNKHLEYPEEAKSSSIEGTVVIEFVVDEDGSIRQIRSDNKESYGLVAEGKRVVGMMPKWKPGMVAGHPVKCYFSVPIIYELSDVQ